MTTPRRTSVLVVALLLVPLAAGAADLPVRLPLGLQAQAAYVPDDNPLTSEKVALGKQLFWDKRWSRNGTVACVSCHDPKHGWADPRRVSLRFDGKPTPRHSPTLVNRLFSDVQQWAGTRASLEDQALKASDQTPELLVRRDAQPLALGRDSAAAAQRRGTGGPGRAAPGAHRRGGGRSVEPAPPSAVASAPVAIAPGPGVLVELAAQVQTLQHELERRGGAGRVGGAELFHGGVQGTDFPDLTDVLLRRHGV
jgi:hypothetical protein